MVIGPDNATGWTELMDGHMISAVFTMYDTAFVGWTVAILFFVYQFMLWLKTRNMALSFITGAFFAVMYASSMIMKTVSLQIMALLLIFELAAIFYLLIWK